jgi:hypothetical protein
MKLQVRIFFPVLALALVLFTGQVNAAARFVDGTQWTKWSMQEKLCYVQGMCNYADFVNQAQTQNQKSYDYCMSKVFVDQLKPKSSGQVIEAVDAYYRDSANLNKPVVEAIIRGATNVCPR